MSPEFDPVIKFHESEVHNNEPNGYQVAEEYTRVRYNLCISGADQITTWFTVVHHTLIFFHLHVYPTSLIQTEGQGDTMRTLIF